MADEKLRLTETTTVSVDGESVQAVIIKLAEFPKDAQVFLDYDEYDGPSLNVSYFREETDAELAARKIHEQQLAAKAAEAKRAAERSERSLYERLKKKYG